MGKKENSEIKLDFFVCLSMNLNQKALKSIKLILLYVQMVYMSVLRDRTNW